MGVGGIAGYAGRLSLAPSRIVKIQNWLQSATRGAVDQSVIRYPWKSKVLKFHLPNYLIYEHMCEYFIYNSSIFRMTKAPNTAPTTRKALVVQVIGFANII